MPIERLDAGTELPISHYQSVIFQLKWRRDFHEHTGNRQFDPARTQQIFDLWLCSIDLDESPPMFSFQSEEEEAESLFGSNNLKFVTSLLAEINAEAIFAPSWMS